MQEFFGLAYFAEIPVVVFDVQRGGPSTGMPTRTQQSDLLVCAFASHGDTKHVLLIPDGPGEAFEFAASAFDFAERLQTLGLRHARSRHRHEFASLRARSGGTIRDAYDRGKVLIGEELEHAVEFGRYDDVDGDGIPYRTLPGAHPTRGAYFTRGTSRDRFARYTEEAAPYIDNMERLLRKFETARGLLPRPVRQAGGEADADRRHPLRIDRGRDGRGPGDAGGRRPACRRVAHPRFSARAGGRRFRPTITIRSSSSSRTATRRCAR